MVRNIMAEETVPFTWPNAFKLGAAVLAEVALLSLVADSSVTFKAASLISAISVLAVIQFQRWIEQQFAGLFRAIAVILAVVYLCFVGYAVSHAYSEKRITAHLEMLYSASAPLWAKKSRLPNQNYPTEDEIKIWESEAQKWEDDTVTYCQEYMGNYTKARFLDATATGYSGGYPPGWMTNTRVTQLRKNLLEIIEARQRSR